MDENLVVVEDGGGTPVEPETVCSWKLSIVDDDPRVHDITRHGLEDFRFEGRGLVFLDAASGTEAIAVLKAEPDIAVVLLDVVMETDAAGLRVVRALREELDNRLVRVILRTGRPGRAPERSVVVDYDINDHKSKAESTATRLFTAVLSALRAHSRLEMSRRGLERILEASTSPYERRSVARFVEGVVTQIRSLVGDSEGAVLCVVGGPRFEGDSRRRSRRRRRGALRLHSRLADPFHPPVVGLRRDRRGPSRRGGRLRRRSLRRALPLQGRHRFRQRPPF